MTLSVAGYEATARVLTEVMGFTAVGQESARFRFNAPPFDDGAKRLGTIVDILCQPERFRSRLGVGSVHHIAFRAASPEHQVQLQAMVGQRGLNVTPVVDRNYFESIYFREPGGVLFEIATNPPGFTADEPLDTMGARLMLPPQYESQRPALNANLVKISLPTGGTLP